MRQKNHITQKELGIALGFPEDSADVRIAQYEADARKPRDEILANMAKELGVPLDILMVPILSEPREYEAAEDTEHPLDQYLPLFGCHTNDTFQSSSSSSIELSETSSSSLSTVSFDWSIDSVSSSFLSSSGFSGSSVASGSSASFESPDLSVSSV